MIDAAILFVVSVILLFALLFGLYMVFVGPLMIALKEDVGWREAYRRVWFDK